MPLISIDDVSSIGVNRDVAGYALPPEAWTLAENMRLDAAHVERLEGRSQVFGTPPVAPHFALPIASASAIWWLYVSLLKGYVYDGTTHTDITRIAGDYTAGATKDWNGTLLGGVPILNNGSDLPQYWEALDITKKLKALTNWDANWTTKVMRAFGPFLLALNVTKSGTNYPHMVKWSHPADPGTIPSSWDAADATKDAGENDLPDVNAGVIRDGLPLAGYFYIYKDASIWRMRNIGGRLIFDFDTFSETTGILAPRCVALTGDGTRHVVATQDDIVVHDGRSLDSVLDKRYRRYYNNSIDTSNFQNSFLFCNPTKNEMWFCFPEQGQTNPTRALIWNYKLGGITEGEVNFRSATLGTLEVPPSLTWASVTGSWMSITQPWSQLRRRRVIVCAPDATKFYQLDSGSQYGTTDFTATLQRTGLSVIGKKRNGDWISDPQADKLVTRVWIKATGGPINVRVGFAETSDSALVWSAAVSFDPETQRYVDVVASGKLVAVEFSSTAATPWKIFGYKIDIDTDGEF